MLFLLGVHHSFFMNLPMPGKVVRYFYRKLLTVRLRPGYGVLGCTSLKGIKYNAYLL